MINIWLSFTGTAEWRGLLFATAGVITDYLSTVLNKKAITYRHTFSSCKNYAYIQNSMYICNCHKCLCNYERILRYNRYIHCSLLILCLIRSSSCRHWQDKDCRSLVAQFCTHSNTRHSTTNSTNSILHLLVTALNVYRMTMTTLKSSPKRERMLHRIIIIIIIIIIIRHL